VKFTIMKGVEGRRLREVLPAEFRHSVPGEVRKDERYTVLLFPHTREDVVRSTEVLKAMRRVPRDSAVVGVGGAFTAEARAALVERGAVIISAGDFYWTDKSYLAIRKLTPRGSGRGLKQQQVDLRIDRFVEQLNRSPRESLDPTEVPDFLREGPLRHDALERVSWAIVPARSRCKWVDDFEAKLPGPLPPSYKSLVSRYLFPVLDVGAVTLFANTGAGVHDELVDAVFRDPGIYVPLFRAGFVQFGRPVTGSYDPVCFDLNRNSKDGECPVVRLDHEVALMQERVQVVADLSDSFWSLVGA
jgi:hypothetical protein